MRFVIVTNPVAGRGRGKRMAEAVCQRLQRAGADARVITPNGRHDCATALRDASSGLLDDARPPLCIVACGGDGTLHDVCNAIMNGDRAKALLGLAPAGRCNDFASALGVRADADFISEVLLDGRRAAIDLGRIGERYFCSVATLGFDSAVARYVNDMSLPMAGAAAYVFGALRTLIGYRSRPVQLVLDDQTVDEPLFLAATANTKSYGGRMRIAPHADPTDGHLDICIIRRVGRLRAVRLLIRVIAGRHTELPEVRMHRARTIHMRSLEARELWADGEYVTSTPATIEVMPKAIEVMVPNHKAL